MDLQDTRKLLLEVAAGRLSPADASHRLAEPSPDFPFARLDHDRERRCGFPEVILAEGKTPDQVATLAGAIMERSGRMLATRVSADQVAATRQILPDVQHCALARVLHLDRTPLERVGLVGVISAGTADLPVAEEAAQTALALGARVTRAPDCGVAGLHRIGAELDLLRSANVLVVVAGFEGALASVVAGLTNRPVIGVPTSVGYGVAREGRAALLGMLSSCAAGLSVVNIDNGFGAGYSAALINRQTAPDSGHGKEQNP